MMNEKKFYVLGNVLGVLCFLVSLVDPVVGILLGIVSMTINIMHREQYRTRIGTSFTVAGFIMSGWIFLFIFWSQKILPGIEVDYWFFKIFS